MFHIMKCTVHMDSQSKSDHYALCFVNETQNIIMNVSLRKHFAIQVCNMKKKEDEMVMMRRAEFHRWNKQNDDAILGQQDRH